MSTVNEAAQAPEGSALEDTAHTDYDDAVESIMDRFYADEIDQRQAETLLERAALKRDQELTSRRIVSEE